MIKRVTFRGVALPLLLVTPQLIITLVFFIWPASQALYQSVLLQDAFGLSTEFVWLDNFASLFSETRYLHSFRITVVFSLGVTLTSMAAALLLAVMADRVIKSATTYRTLLVWPYATAGATA